MLFATHFELFPRGNVCHVTLRSFYHANLLKVVALALGAGELWIRDAEGRDSLLALFAFPESLCCLHPSHAVASSTLWLKLIILLTLPAEITLHFHFTQLSVLSS